MKRAMIVGVVLLFFCGSAYAAEYTWTAGAVTRSYDNVDVWNGGDTTYPSTAADNLILTTAGAVCEIHTNGTVTLGEIHATEGWIETKGYGPTFRMVAGSGYGGDFLVLGNARYANRVSGTNHPETVDADGDVKIRGAHNGWAMSALRIIMRGQNKKFAVGVYEDVPNTITIADCASVSYSTEMSVPSTGGANFTGRARHLVVDGTITGGDWMIGSDVTIGPNGQFTGGTVETDLTSSNSLRTYKFGGGTYYNLKPETARYHNSIEGLDLYRVYRAMGHITVSNDFDILPYTANERSGVCVFDTDNGDGVNANLTVEGDFSLGHPTHTSRPQQYRGLKTTGATIDLNGDTYFRSYSYVQGGTSTFKFAGDVDFHSNAWFDNSDMSQTSVVIDGASTQYLAFSNRLALGDVDIQNTSASTVVLDDNMLLVGNLTVDPAAHIEITNETDAFILRGGIDNEPDAQEIHAGGADLVSLSIVGVKNGSNSYAKLMSNLILSDNLNIAVGSRLYLNGHTLTPEGGAPWVSDQVDPDGELWKYGEGYIYGTAEIPEPGTMLLLGTGLIGVVGLIRRRRMK